MRHVLLLNAVGGFDVSSQMHNNFFFGHVFFSQSFSKHGLQQLNKLYSPSDVSIFMIVVRSPQISHAASPIWMSVDLPYVECSDLHTFFFVSSHISQGSFLYLASISSNKNSALGL
jgi:hypothetical protein